MDVRVLILLALEIVGLGLFLLWHSGLLKSRAAWLLSALLLIVAFALRIPPLSYETLDYQNFLSRWAAFYRENGGFLAMDRSVGNYNIPYLYFLALYSYINMKDLYLIKLLSILFDMLLAWSAMLLTSRFQKSPARLLGCFFAVLYLPTVFLNSAVWSQCDSIYVALAVLGIYLALADRPTSSMVCIALSFGFKLQAVFVMPIYAVLWMMGKFKWKHFLIFPLSYVILVLPAVLLGRPFLDTITLYFNQTGSIGSGLNYNSASIFAIFTHVQDKKLAAGIAVAAAFVCMINLLAVAWANRARLNERCVLALSLLFAISIPFLLPHMHDRYFYAADILSLVLAFSFPAYSLTALLVEFASFLGYHAYLKMRYLLLMHHGAAALIVAMALALLCFLLGLEPVEPERTPKGSRAKKSRPAGNHS